MFQSGWFIVGLLTQTLVVHMIRTRHVAFLQSRAAVPVVVATALIVTAAFVLPLTWIGARLQLVALPATFLVFACLCAIAYAAAVELVKRLYVRRFHEWL